MRLFISWGPRRQAHNNIGLVHLAMDQAQTARNYFQKVCVSVLCWVVAHVRGTVCGLSILSGCSHSHSIPYVSECVLIFEYSVLVGTVLLTFRFYP